jgi:hypothetical protein
MNEYIVSVDIAKKRDFTTIMITKDSPMIVDGKVILDQVDRAVHYFDVVHIDQFQGLTYPDIADTVTKLMSHSSIQNNADLLVDGTGVGEAAVDIMRLNALSPIPIVFTGGSQEREVHAEMGSIFQTTQGKLAGASVVKEIHVPKVNLVSAGKLLIQQRRLRVAPGLKWGPAFEKQLMGFRGKVNENKVKYEAETEDTHDDLVVVFLMTAWWIGRQRRSERDMVISAKNEQLSDWNPMDF